MLISVFPTANLEYVFLPKVVKLQVSHVKHGDFVRLRLQRNAVVTSVAETVTSDGDPRHAPVPARTRHTFNITMKNHV